MSVTTAPQRIGKRSSVRTRTIRLIALVVMGAFIIFGIAALIGVQSSARNIVRAAQVADVTSIYEQVDLELDQAIDDLRRLAGTTAARDFASATLGDVTGNPAEIAQAPLIEEFEALMSMDDGNYLAIRYVTFSGAVWTEVTRIGGLTRTITRVRPNEFNDDETLTGALGSGNGDVIASELDFRTNPDAPTAERLTPFVRFASPVLTNASSTNIAGVIQIDLAISPVFDLINAAGSATAAAQPGRRLIITDDLGRVLSDSSVPNTNFLRNLANRVPQLFEQTNPVLASAVETTGVTELAEADDLIFTMTRLPLAENSTRYWQIILVDERGINNVYLISLAVVIFVGCLGLGGLIVVLVDQILRRTLRPLQQINAIAAGTGGVRTAQTSSNDELGDLLNAFAAMRDAQVVLNTELDAQKGRFNRNLDIAARIGRETASLYNTDELLNRAINLICDEFGYYHAQVFRIDDAGVNAVLVYSRGQTGAEMLRENYRLPVGSNSVIGTVTKTGKALIITDSQNISPSQPFQYEPRLPNTRSEMALPLIVGQRVIGGLDIQSKTVGAFRDDDVRMLQIMADQIAIALENARLLEESQERFDQIDALNRQLTNINWDDPQGRSDLQSVYRYDLLKVQRGGDTLPLTDSSTDMRIPISIRGEVIGSLEASTPQGIDFTDSDESIMRAVADRLGIAIENARLFEQQQASLQETSTLYQLVRALNEANSLEEVLQSIVVSVMPDAISAQIGVFDNYNRGDTPRLLEVLADWTSASDDQRDVQLSGLQLNFLEHPILYTMQPNQVVLINDAERDVRLDEVFRAIVSTTSGRAMVIIPVTVRGVWRGVLMAQFGQPRDFSDREGRVFSSLIDQAGVVIDNRMLLRDNEKNLDQVERLYSASRSINMSVSPADLVSAAAGADESTDRDFELALFEGALEAGGWPSQIRVSAYSRGGKVFSSDDVYNITISPESPLRAREAQIVTLLSESTADDSPTSLSLTSYVRARGNRFAAVFPLFSVNQPIALFLVTSEQAREALSEDDYEAYKALTGQMSTVLQNRRLLDQTSATLDETRRLYAASRAIASAQDQESIYEAAARYLTLPTAPLTRMSVLLANTPTPYAQHVEYSYIHTREENFASDVVVGTQVPATLVPFGEMLLDSRSMAFNRPEDFDEFPALQALINRSGSQSAAVISLQSRQQWFGVLLIEGEQVNTFSDGYLVFSQAVGDQIAIALDALRLFQEARSQAQRALALAQAGQLANRIGSEFDLSIAEVFIRVSDAAEYDRWLLSLYDEESQGLKRVVEYSAERGIADSTTEGGIVPIDIRGIPMVDAYHLGRMLLVNDPRSYPDFPTNYAGLEDFAPYVGKHIAIPIIVGNQVIGSMAIGRDLSAQDLDENDEELVTTLAAQVAIAVENRRLFRAAEGERQNLRSILETLPAGVLVLDANTYHPIQFNQQAIDLLGREIDADRPFSVKDYNLFQTSRNALFITSEMPIFQASKDMMLASSDDVTVIQPNGGRTNLLVNAAPITDENGDVTAIVAAFQDISKIRELEGDLQLNLSQTRTLYETTRAFAEGNTLEELLDQVISRLSSLQPVPDNAFVLLLESEGLHVARAFGTDEADYNLPDDILTQTSALVIPNVQNASPINDDTRAALNMLDIQAFFSLPLLARARSETPLGWLVGVYHQPQPTLVERAGFLSTLTDSAAVAIDNRNLFRDTRSALQDTNDLYRATTMISRARGRDQLSEALRVTVETLKPDVYAAYLYQNEDGTRELVELFNENLDAAPLDFASLIEQFNLSSFSNLFIDDLRSIENPSAFETALLDLGTIRSLGLVRTVSNRDNQPSGEILIGYHRPRRFDDSTARYLGAITDSAAVIIDNLLLLGQIQNNLNETSTLYQASRALSDAVTPADIVEVAQKYLRNRPLSAVFMAMLVTKGWHQQDSMVRVTASWRDEEKKDEIVDLRGITLSSEQFPAWRLLAVDDVYTIDDTTDITVLDEMEQAGVLSIGMLSAAFLPLRVSGNAIGTLVIGSQTPYRHTERDLRVYRSFAEQASLRLEATRLFDQAQRRAAQLALSADVSGAASSILDLQFLLSRIVDLIKDAFKYDHVQIFLMDQNDEYAVLRASTGEAGRNLLSVNHKLARGSASVIGQVTDNAQPTIAADTADARVVHRPNPYLPGTRSELALPLVLKGLVVGALDVQSNQPNAFDDDDIAVLKTLSAQISVAIDNAGLYEDAQRRAKDTAFLFNVTSQAAAADTLENALSIATDDLRAELTSLVAVMYLPRFYVESESENMFTQLEPVAMAGIDMPLSELTPVRLDQPDNLIAEAGDKRRPFILTELNDETRYFPVAEGARSALIVPLVSGAQLIGLLVSESAQPNAYTDATLTLMQTLAGSLAAIVQNQQLLEQVQRQNDLLRELDRLKSDFLANMSHELRTPLNSIIGFSRVILKGIDGPLTEMQEQDLSTIYNSGLHLLNLINDILDQAKIAAGKMDLQSDYFDMKGVIDGVRSIGIGLVKEKPIDIQVHLAPGLPKAYGDEFRTRQILINLISNAAKFTRQGTIVMDVYPVKHESTRKLMLRVDVTDSGIGIADKDIPLLFEEFRQVDSSLTRTQGGTGLGLPIAKSLVEMQGGEMRVKSQVNEGSTFSILLPTEPVIDMSEKGTGELKKPTGRLGKTAPLDPSVVNASGMMMNSVDETQERPHEDSANDSPQAFPATRPPMHIKRQILLIEDNPEMVDQFRRVLQREGFDIFAASIPLEAEAMASGLHPTLIVMDVNFADGQGWNILERLKGRDDTRDIPVVVVTINPDEARVYETGAFAYLPRPFTPEMLAETILNAEREARIDRILIIDDQADSIKIIEDLLSEQGHYKVFTAGSAMDGISMVARRRPDLVILDLRMPEMDGFQVISELRSNPETATIPIIVVTGETLNASERDQLTNLPVLFKADINAGQRKQFMDGVKANLTRTNGN